MWIIVNKNIRQADQIIICSFIYIFIWKLKITSCHDFKSFTFHEMNWKLIHIVE